MKGAVFNTIQELRSAAGLTQETLAQRTGVTRQTIIAIEKGNYTPSVAVALRLAGVLKKKVDDIFVLK